MPELGRLWVETNGVKVTSDYVLEPSGAGTRLTQSLDAKASGLTARMLIPVVQGPAGDQAQERPRAPARGAWRVMRALLVLAFVLFAAAPASAQSLSGIADTLRTDHVYVDPGAELADQVDADALQAKIGDAPTFIAVLPASAEQSSAGRTLVALRQAVGVSGTYALAIGDDFRTLSDEFGDAAQAGSAIRAKNPDDLGATLNAFADRAAQEREGGGGGGLIVGALVILLLLGLAVGGFALVASRRRNRGDGRSTVGEISVNDDFERLGDAIRALDLDITLGEVGRPEYERALAAYERANSLQRKGDEAGANRALDEGLAAVAAARERIAGR